MTLERDTGDADRAATWLGLADDDVFGPAALPYGVVVDTTRPPWVVARIGNRVLDLGSVAAELLPARAALLTGSSLDPLLAAGPQAWAEVRSAVTAWVSDATYRPVVEPALRLLDDVRPVLPFTVADYVDFYASEHHATRLGELFRPGQPPLPAAWKHLPIGYHGRAGTVVVSGTDVRRPSGQRREPDGTVTFGPTRRLDMEAELGFVVGAPSRLGEPVGLTGLRRHVFGVCVVNDWSARDIQAFEYVPLGPFLGKSFATSVSPWLLPLAALEPARVAPPTRGVPLLAYLDDGGHELWGLDIELEVRLNGMPLSRVAYGCMYWTPAQMLAHLTANGASLRTGDLFASGTVSGPGSAECGSLIELTANGARPLRLPDGTSRGFLDDGDHVVISATAAAPRGRRIGLGEVSGRVLPGGGQVDLADGR